MPTTRDIAALAYDLVDRLAAVDGEATDEVDDLLDAFSDAAEDKLGALHAVYRRLQAEEAAEDGHMRRAKRRRDAARTGIARVEHLVLCLLRVTEAVTGEARASGDGWRVRIASSVRVEVSEQGARMLAETRPELAPLQPRPDKTRIRKALQAGEKLQGCTLVEGQHARWS